MTARDDRRRSKMTPGRIAIAMMALALLAGGVTLATSSPSEPIGTEDEVVLRRDDSGDDIVAVDDDDDDDTGHGKKRKKRNRGDGDDTRGNEGTNGGDNTRTGNTDDRNVARRSGAARAPAPAPARAGNNHDDSWSNHGGGSWTGGGST
jgi:hypothetical protein